VVRKNLAEESGKSGIAVSPFETMPGAPKVAKNSPSGTRFPAGKGPAASSNLLQLPRQVVDPLGG